MRIASPALRICEQNETSLEEELVDIYLITGPTGKRYVGQAKRTVSSCSGAARRWKQHCCLSKSLVSKAIHKHGKANFCMEVLTTVPRSRADDSETFAIVAYNSLVPAGYNILPGGVNGAGKMAERGLRRLSTEADAACQNARTCRRTST